MILNFFIKVCGEFQKYMEEELERCVGFVIQSVAFEKEFRWSFKCSTESLTTQLFQPVQQILPENPHHGAKR
jgi:hypothetical protein